MNFMENQTLSSKKEGERIDLVRVCKEICRRRRFLIKAILVGFVFGVIAKISLPKEYSTLMKLAPEATKNKSGQVMSLASLMGITPSDKSEEGISADYYPEIVHSTPFLISFRDVVVKPEGLSEMSLYEYLVFHQKKAWWEYVLQLPHVVKGIFSDEEVKLDSTWDPFYLTGTQGEFVNELKERVVFEKSENKNIVSLKIVMQDPVVAAVVGNFLVRELEEYIAHQKQMQVMKDLRFTRRMYDETRLMYDSLSLQSGNRNLQLNVDMTLGVLNMLSQQYEILKLRLDKEYETFSVIEPATVPLYSSNASWVLVVGGSVFLFGFVALMWILFSFAFAIDYKDGK